MAHGIVNIANNTLASRQNDKLQNKFSFPFVQFGIGVGVNMRRENQIRYLHVKMGKKANSESGKMPITTHSLFSFFFSRPFRFV